MYLNISPIDGRYEKELSHLSRFFSEFALMHKRCLIELLYIEALDKTGLFNKLSNDEKGRIDDCKNNFSHDDHLRIKEIEKLTNHDVKACEIFLREKIKLQNNHMIHFGLTSEDVNNLAYSLILKEFLANEQLPLIKSLLEKLSLLAEKWKEIPFPTRTHGQKASPSTAGKELAVFISRILRQYKKLKTFKFFGKLNGATGNFSALSAAFPAFDWFAFSNNFIESLSLIPNICTTQIEDHDCWAEYFNITRQVNTIITDLDVDFWLYMTLGLFTMETTKDSVGSSTMPHKINPINFENSEGNLTISNSLFGMLSEKLCRSRMQRDLSDSTVTRNIGVALSHSILAIKETIKGLNKININEKRCIEELDNSLELLAEPIQTILKKTELQDPYELMKKLTRENKIDINLLYNFIDQLDVDINIKNSLKELKTTKYTGYASKICSLIIEECKKESIL